MLTNYPEKLNLPPVSRAMFLTPNSAELEIWHSLPGQYPEHEKFEVRIGDWHVFTLADAVMRAQALAVGRAAALRDDYPQVWVWDSQHNRY